jgi:hypothetical protein
LKGVWGEFVRNEINVWVDFHRYWLQQAQSGLSVLFVRFEDVLTDKDGCVRQILDFLGENNGVLHRLLCGRLSTYAAGQAEARVGYPPRKVKVSERRIELFFVM